MTFLPDNIINIVHVISSLSLGGAEAVLEKLVCHTQGRKITAGAIRNQVVSLTGDGPIGERLTAAGIPVTPFNMRHPVGLATAPIHLAQLIRRSRPVIVNAWMYHANLVATVAARLAGGAPLIWGIHHHEPADRDDMKPGTIRIARLCGKLSHRAPDALVYVSDSTRITHESAGYRSRDSRVIHNGFDLDLFKPDPAARVSVRRELGLAEDALLIGFASRFVPFKDHKLFLAALARVSTDGVRAIMCGLGNEPGNRELMRLIDDAGVADRVHLLGPRQDMPRLTASWDLAVNSSWQEGFCLAIGEALAASVPCVTTDIGDITEAVAHAGCVVQSRDPDDLAAAIDQVFALSTQERVTLGRRGRQYATENYSMETNVQKWLALYEALASGKKSRSRSS